MSVSIQGNGTVSEDGGTGTDLLSGLVKTWCLHNCSTAAIADSSNISSITDNGVGDFDLNINNDMASADHGLLVNTEISNVANHYDAGRKVGGTRTAAAQTVFVMYNGAASDIDSVSSVFMGALA